MTKLRANAKYLNICSCENKHTIRKKTQCPAYKETRELSKQINKQKRYASAKFAYAQKSQNQRKVNLKYLYLKTKTLALSKSHSKDMGVAIENVMAKYFDWLDLTYDINSENSKKTLVAKNIKEALVQMGIPFEEVSVLDRKKIQEVKDVVFDGEDWHPVLPENYVVKLTTRMLSERAHGKQKKICIRRGMDFLNHPIQTVQDFLEIRTRSHQQWRQMREAAEQNAFYRMKAKEEQTLEEDRKASKQLSYINQLPVSEEESYISPIASQETIECFKALVPDLPKVSKPKILKKVRWADQQEEQKISCSQHVSERYVFSEQLLTQIQERAQRYEQKQENIKKSLEQMRHGTEEHIMVTLLEQLYLALQISMVSSKLLSQFVSDTFHSNRWSGKFCSTENIQQRVLKIVRLLPESFKVATRQGKMYIAKKTALPAIFQLKQQLRDALYQEEQ